jgi:hypothetical protein
VGAEPGQRGADLGLALRLAERDQHQAQVVARIGLEARVALGPGDGRGLDQPGLRRLGLRLQAGDDPGGEERGGPRPRGRGGDRQGEGGLAEAATLRPQAGRVPEPAQLAGQTEVQVGLGRAAPGQGPSQVVDVALQAIEPGAPLAGGEVRLGGRDLGGEVAGVAALELGGLAAGAQALGGVLAHQLEQQVAGRAVLLAHHHQRAVDQAAEHVEQGPGLARVGAHRLGGVEGEAAAEHRQPGEERLLLAGEQVVAPVDGRAQRAVAGDGVARAGGEQAEAVVQAGEQLLGGEQAHARGGQLDGERQPVEPRAERGDIGEVRRRDLEARRHGGGAFGEQGDGVIAAELLGRRQAGEIRQAERRDGVFALPVQPERRAAGRQHPQGRAAGEQLADEGRGGQQMLDIVEHEQQVAVAQVAEQHLLDRRRPGFLQPEAPHDAGGDEAGIEDRRQGNEADAILEHVPRAGGDRDRQPRLAGAGGPAERDQPGVLLRQQVEDLDCLPLPPQQGGALRRQVEVPEAEGAQRRKLRHQAGGEELMQVLRLRHVAQLMPAERAQAEPRRQVLRQQSPRRLGHEDLATVPGLA